MTAYYNEFDPKAAAWLRELISAGHIAPGDVDERSIADVRPADLDGYTQCHFFAGIGVWSYALRRAGWPDNRPVWTGSCPCQPFSAAGKGGGFDDERHLWPHFHYLIEQCRPGVVAGEQVASKDGLAWLDLVQADMEGTAYAFGALDFCSAGVGAPHIRQRLYWLGERLEYAESDGRVEWRPEPSGRGFAGRRADVWLADDDDDRLQGRAIETVFGAGRREEGPETERLDAPRLEWLADASSRRRPEGVSFSKPAVLDTDSSSRWMADDDRNEQRAGRGYGNSQNQGFRPYLDGRGAHGGLVDTSGRPIPQPIGRSDRRDGHATAYAEFGRTGPTNGFWRDADWLHCRDHKWRPVEPGAFPLAHGAPARVGRLRGYGNAINAEAAQAFIEAYLETKAVEHFRLTEVLEDANNIDGQEGIFG